MQIYFSFLFILMAFYFLFIGGKVIISKRPIFISSMYIFSFMVLALSPEFVTTANILFKNSPGKIHLFSYFSPIMFISILIFFWFQMKGYMAIGISDDSFREALHFSLNKNKLPFEEKLSVVSLPSINAVLQVSIQSWIGAGQLKLKGAKSSKILPDIVTGINEYYIGNNIRPNNITPVFYIIMGVFMLVFAFDMI